MKIHKTISISEEINRELRNESNASELIETLLENHFRKNKKTDAEICADVKQKMEEEEAKESNKARRDTESEKVRKAIIKDMESYVDEDDEA